jgi:folate-binding protein YgfZ
MSEGSATDTAAGAVAPRERAAEYQAARSGAVVAARDDRVVLRVTGRDPVRMLQGLITNDLAGAPEGGAVYGAFLTPKGRMVAEARLLRREGAVLVETAAAAESGLRQHLKKYVPPLFARLEERSGLAVLGVYGPCAAGLVADLPVDDAGAVLEALEQPEGEGRELLLPATSLEPVRQRLLAAGARPVSWTTLDVLRIEAGRPRWGAELDETTIPLEAGLQERAISTTKGCYTGQEVIIRILHRGHVNRSLRGLLLGEVASPAAGAVLMLPGQEKPVGVVTSACISPALGQTIALAYVRREVLSGASVLVDGLEGRVVEVPGWR